jgi:peptide/histidine transporter 3/4
MDRHRHITSNFKIPAGSFGVFITLEVFITAGVYDCIFFPLASKIRIGIGIFFSVLDFVVSAIVESLRRRKAIQEGYIILIIQKQF